MKNENNTPLLNQLFAENSELKDRVAELESENERQQSEITDWVYNSEQLCLQRDTLQTTLETEQANLSREKKMFERVLGEILEACNGGGMLVGQRLAKIKAIALTQLTPKENNDKK